ncbi:hypothetical protein HRI_003154300 [Hibiscus trionum]|uniref:Transposase-associated domain-containing protein n=1 Tax=Hibiscus trionum TaxID=183268 RepID=A0A9W7ME26_HIBTR|nr:hypothetical protein HRI_003154300 [Hibiscus trionum]
MNRSWMNLPRVSVDYRNGVEIFLNFAFAYASQEDMILCPCKKCANINWHIREVVHEHLIVCGFVRGYIKWIFHGEITPRRASSTSNSVDPLNSHRRSHREDDMEDMKKMIKDLGLGYEKINSCPNDCMLYWGDRKN